MRYLTRVFPAIIFLTVFLRVEAVGFRPYVYPVPELPVGTGRVFWANADLAGTSAGVLYWDGARWQQTFPDREVLAIGLMPEGWWAAGSGFVGFSGGRFVSAADEFLGGVYHQGSVFLVGAKGVWSLRDKELRLVRAVPASTQARLFHVGSTLHLFVGGLVEVWNGQGFLPASDWKGFKSQDLSKVRAFGSGYYLLATEGLFYREGTTISPVFEEGFGALFSRGTVDFAVGTSEVVLATYYDGMRALAPDGRFRWELGVSELGGNPYSFVRTPTGYRVGTSGGAMEVCSELLHRLPLVGEDVLSVSSEKAFFASGALDLATGSLVSTPYLVEGDGVSGTWGKVVLPSGREVVTGGREYVAVGRFQGLYYGAHGSGLYLFSEEGSVLAKFLVTGANSALAAGDSLWVGTATGLFRLREDTLSEVRSGGVYSVARGVDGPVFFSGRTLSFPDGSTRKLPGKVLALDRDFVAIRVGDSVFVGRYADGWQPLDLPQLPASVLRLRCEGDYLYVFSRTEVLRVFLPRVGVLELAAGGARRVEVDSSEFVERLPGKRLGPWLSAGYTVYVDGEAIPVGDRELRLRGVGYGTTAVTVVATLAGLRSETRITVFRPRPWWLDWPGGLLGLVLALSLVWLLTRWRTRLLLKKAEELKRLVDERTRALDEALKAREFFFSSVSHEIRNPLNGVVGLCSLLNEAQVGPRERVLVQTLNGCSDQLRRILDDVLDFSRIDRGVLEFYPEAFDLGLAVEGASRSVDPTLERVQVSAPAGVWVESDVGKVRQVVTNLVSNALKYGVPSLARVGVHTEIRGDGRLGVTVDVANSGPDLPGSELERIFEGFHRGEEAKKRRLPGSGLGLALSRRLARALGGDLTVTSGGGLTTFSLRLEVRPASAPEKVSFSLPKSGVKALAIEDESYNRLVLGGFLTQLGYDVDWAVDGASALERVRTGTYDLILSDYMLPDTDGVLLVQEIVKLLPDPRPPIVMVTAYSTQEKQDAAFAAGASGFVVKPVTIEKLRSAVLGFGYHQRGRRSVDLYRSEGRFDFSVFKKMPDGRSALGRYAEDVEVSFRALQGLVETPEQLRKASHALRGRILVVHAMALAEQLSCLEGAADLGDREKMRSVLSILEPMVSDLVETARSQVFSSGDFGKPLGDGVAH